MVFVGEATAGPANHWHMEIAQSRDHVIAKAVGVGNRGVLAHPHAAIDTGSKVLGKLSEDVPVDLRARLIGANRNLRSHRRIVLRSGRRASSGSPN